jgi:hypothetical protein
MKKEDDTERPELEEKRGHDWLVLLGKKISSDVCFWQYQRMAQG